MISQTELIKKIHDTHRVSPIDGDFSGVDLRGANLSGISLSMVSFAAANLDGANLTGCQFRQVDLTNTSFKNAKLDRTRFELVNAGSASFVGAQASESRWELVNLTGSDFSSTNLTHAVFRNSTLESSCFNDADLSEAMLVYSNADTASFRRACFLWTSTTGSTFTHADFSDAKKFFLCREIIVEILRREIGNDLERAKLVGSVAISKKWCYPEWKEFLKSDPQYHKIACDIFRRYPKSGFIEALRVGWKISDS